MKKRILYLNAGHGGMHPATKAYMTNPAHGKFYHFTDTAGKVVYSAYEGKTNRECAKAFQDAMQGTGVEIVRVYHDFLDTHHMERVAIVNKHFAEQKNAVALYLSFHSNAVGMSSRGASQSANGWSIWTTDGITASDGVADIITGEVKKIAPTYGINVLESKWQDGDSDFEANFDELYFTATPAVLIENLFFTNLKDAQTLANPAYQKAHAEAVKAGVLRWFAKLG